MCYQEHAVYYKKETKASFSHFSPITVTDWPLATSKVSQSLFSLHIYTPCKRKEKKNENYCHISVATSSALPLMLATATRAMKMRHGRELTDKTQKAATITLVPRVTGVGGARVRGRQQPPRITTCLFSDMAAERDFHTDLPYKC